MLATVPGNFAWGFVVGLGMVNTGLSLVQSLSYALAVYSGSAQMVALPLLGSGAALSLLGLAVLLACIRFMIYSAALSTSLNHLPMAKRLFVGAFSIDGAIGLFLQKRSRSGPGRKAFTHRISYLMGMNTIVWSAWTSGMVMGIFAAGLLPPSEKFTYLGIVALLGIVVPMIRDRAALCCALAAGVVALLTAHWPYQLGLLGAILVGIATGFASKQRLQT